MPEVNPSSRCHASSTERAYCIPEFFDNSPIKLQLIRAESAAKEIHPVKSYASIFVSVFARGWPLRSVSTVVTFTSTFRYFPLSHPRPVLPCPYLNNRSTLSQVRSAHSYRSFLPRKFIASFNNALFFSFVFLFLDEPEVESGAISTFPTIKELGQNASYTSTAISSISTVVIN